MQNAVSPNIPTLITEKSGIISDIILFVVIFCYIFAFYVFNISISILISLPLFALALLKTAFLRSIIDVIKSRYIYNITIAWFVLLLFSVLYPAIFQTYDLSLFKIVVMQAVHIIAAIPVLAYIKYKRKKFEYVEKTYVSIFLLQTLIQLLVINSPSLAEAIRSFNKFDPDVITGIGSNVRGVALSAATTYHLSLVYGICFILYVKNYISQKVSIVNVIIGLLIFVGIFFTGRTAFVGVLFAIAAYFLSIHTSIKLKIKLLFLVPLVILLCVILISICSPKFYELLNKNVLPYAFEFYYSLENSNSMETASTNVLKSMWQSDLNFYELLLGSGQYTDPITGRYYMSVDPGILRHLLFMGIIGYSAIVIYQLLLLPVYRMDKQTRYYYGVILLYLFVMEFKAVTIGINKFTLSTCLLLSYCYLELKHEKNSIHNRIPAE